MIAQLDRSYTKNAKSRIPARLISYFFFEGRPLTTKGRFLNPFVLLFLRVISRIPSPKKEVNPIFIVGTGRSGTTVLGKILSTHRDVGFLNEPKAIWYIIDKLDDLVGNYSKGIGQYFFTKQDASEVKRTRMKNIYGWYLFLTGRKVVVDKYPEMIFRYDYLSQIFPKARFVFITRKGADTGESISYWSESHGSFDEHQKIDWWGVNEKKWKLLTGEVLSQSRYDGLVKLDQLSEPDKGLLEWILAMEEGLKIDAHSDRLTVVKYEDLVNKTDTFIPSLLESIDLSPDEKLQKYASSVIEAPKEKTNPPIHESLQGPYSEVMDKLYN